MLVSKLPDRHILQGNCTFVRMINRHLRIVFMGTPGFAVISLQYLLEAGYPIVGVITAPDKPGGRGMKEMISSPVKQFALANQLWDLADLIEKGVPLRIEERLAAGQYVRVKAGLLKDKRGVIMKRAGKTRLFVFVNELLGGVSLEIEQHLLEPY